MSPATLTWLSALLVAVGVVLIFAPLPSWAHWVGCGLCGLSIYVGWRR